MSLNYSMENNIKGYFSGFLIFPIPNFKLCYHAESDRTVKKTYF